MNFCCIAKWFSYTYVDILFHILFHYGLSQDIEYSSLIWLVWGPYLGNHWPRARLPQPALATHYLGKTVGSGTRELWAQSSFLFLITWTTLSKLLNHVENEFPPRCKHTHLWGHFCRAEAQSLANGRYLKNNHSPSLTGLTDTLGKVTWRWSVRPDWKVRILTVHKSPWGKFTVI